MLVYDKASNVLSVSATTTTSGVFTYNMYFLLLYYPDVARSNV